MKMTIRTKLLAGFLSVIVLMGVLGLVSYRSLESMARAGDRQAVAFEKAAEVEELALGIKKLQDLPTDYTATGDKKNRTDFPAAQKETSKVLASRQQRASRADTKTLYEGMEQGLGTLIRAGTATMALDNPVGNPQVPALMKDIDSAANELQQALTKIRTIYQHDAENERAGTDRLEQQVKIELIAVLLLAVVVGVGIALFLAQGISRPVRQVAMAARQLAEGDLTVEELRVSTGDELGEMAKAFNRMTTNLRDLIGRVGKSAQTVASASEQLNSATEQVAQAAQGVAQAVSQVAQGATSQSKSVQETSQVVEQLRTAIGQIASGAQEQARSAQQTSGVVNQMVKAIEDVADKAQNVSASSQQATESARTGSRVVAQTVTGMGRIQQRVLESAERIKELGKLSDQIGEITQVITDIADQTNLLALNAAIEAARAGEHGKGFAVVAEEVRKLAERAGTSAKEIAGLIHNIQDGTALAVKAMEQGTTEVQEGSRLAADAGKALEGILGVVERTTRDVEAITAAAEQIAASSQEVVKSVESVAAITEENTAATEEMAAGSDQVTRSVEGIASVSQENAAASEEVSASVEEMNASMEEIAASAQSLAQVGNELQNQVALFRV